MSNIDWVGAICVWMSDIINVWRHHQASTERISHITSLFGMNIDIFYNMYLL